MSFLRNIKEHWECFKSTPTLKKGIGLVFKVLGILLLCAGIIWLFYALITFITKHMDALILGGSVIGAILIWGWYKGKQKALANTSQRQSALANQQRQQAEDDYIFIRNALFQVHRELIDVTHLPHISSPSGLDAPSHSVSWNGVPMYQYLIPKGNCALTLEELQELYRTRMQQKLDRNEVAGLNQSMYVHTSGRRYSIILLHSVTDNGTYYQFDYVFAGSRYCTLLENTQATKYHSGTIPVDTRDHDF